MPLVYLSLINLKGGVDIGPNLTFFNNKLFITYTYLPLPFFNCTQWKTLRENVNILSAIK